MYDIKFSAGIVDDEEFYHPEYVPVEGANYGTKSGTLTNLPEENVPFGGTNHGTQCGTKSGTLTASQPLCPKASQSPKNKIEEKDKNLSGSIPQYEGIQSPKTNH